MNILNKFIKGMKQPHIVLLFLLEKTAILFPDKIFLSIKFRLIMRKKLDLKDPQTFNEKLQWLKLFDRKPFYTQMVDKVDAKVYVSKIIGDQYIIPTLGVWSKYEDIDFGKLPEQFVLKTTHDSGTVTICKDRNSFDYKKCEKLFKRRLKRRYFYPSREWPYKNIRPRIIAEQYLPSENDLIDYKFFCFNGIVKYCQVIAGRSATMTIDFYDLDWNHADFNEPEEYPNALIKHNRPYRYKEMIEKASILSKGFPFLRVDFYECNDSIYFGELTFFPTSGFGRFKPEKWSKIFGSWILLPNKS